MTNDEIADFIHRELPIKVTEKQTYGEVFTPPELIERVLGLFPKNVWTNPDKRWMDPCGGVGFFLIGIYQRLMKGLAKWQPDLQKRAKHIIQNMLYMVELNPKNCAICKSLFGPKLNLISTDFLSDFSFDKPKSDNKSKKELQVHLYFDYIVGNPPFHDDFGQSSKGKRINGGKNKLYERIFIKSYDLLKDKGSIAFIVPDNIFAGNTSAAYKILLKNDVPVVSFQRDSRVFFPGIQQPFCYFLMNKVNSKRINTSTNKTIIEKYTDTNDDNNNNERFQVVLKDRPVNPVRNWTPYSEKLVTTFVSNKRNKVVYNRGKALTEYKGTKYPIIYTASQKLATGDKELAVGWGQPKAVVFLISPTFAFEMDYKGKYGVGPNTLYIPFDTVAQGKKIERFLNSEDYKVLAAATQTSRQYIKIALIEYLSLDKIMEEKKKTRRVNKLVKRNTKRKRIY